MSFSELDGDRQLHRAAKSSILMCEVPSVPPSAPHAPAEPAALPEFCLWKTKGQKRKITFQTLHCLEVSKASKELPFSWSKVEAMTGMKCKLPCLVILPNYVCINLKGIF